MIGPMSETDGRYSELVAELCDEMERIYRSRGCYVEITVQRQWSHHNPLLSGKSARPSAYRWYLERELLKLARKGTEIRVASRASGLA